MIMGTEQLKKDLIVLAKLVKAVDGALADGKVSVAEGIGLAFKAVDLIGVVKNLKAAKEELWDLDATESTELVELFKKEFDLSNDKAEEIVETIVELALQVSVASGVFSEGA